MVKRSTTLCAVCNQPGIDFSLTDERAVHKVCVEHLDKLVNQDASKTLVISDKSSDIKRAIQALNRKRSSLSGWLAARFGRDFDKESTHLQSELIALHAAEQLKKLLPELDLSDRGMLSNQLAEIYDHWPDYPPDWEERRNHLKETRGHGCEECGSQDRVQAHHLTPFWKGGSNTPRNLQLLCIRCHGHEHGKDFEVEGFSDSHSRLSDKEERIRSAIAQGKKITFMYKKFNQKQGSRRTILPEEFVDVNSGRRAGFTRCISGQCDLRGEERCFAVHRMYKVEVKE